MVTVYTKPNCIQCTQTKKALTKKGISYKIIDVTENLEAYNKVVSMGFKSAPVVVTNNEAWAGFQPDKINNI
jgi:glutaredoxin-like protein NrdH